MHTRAEWGRSSRDNGAGLWQPSAPAASEPFNKDWLLQFTQHLQTTLDPRELIRVYGAEAGSVIPFDHVAYENPERELRVDCGQAALHGQQICRADTISGTIGASESLWVEIGMIV